MARTFIQARKEILDTLAANGWTLSDTHLKVPHATSPAGRYRLWFRAQAVYFTRIGVPRAGMDDSFAVVHSFKDARTLSYTLDIRKASAVAFVTWIAKVYPDSGQTLPVRPSPYATTAPLASTPKSPQSLRPAPRKYESVARLNRPYMKAIKWPDPTDEEFDRAQKDIGYLNERELRGILGEYGVYYHPSDSLSVLRTVARENLDEKFPVTAIPRSEVDPRQIRWAAAGKKRHGKGKAGRMGGKKRHPKGTWVHDESGALERYEYEVPGGLAASVVRMSHSPLGDRWMAFVYRNEMTVAKSPLSFEVKPLMEWCRQKLQELGLTGGKRRHGAVKLAAEVDGLLRK